MKKVISIVAIVLVLAMAVIIPAYARSVMCANKNNMKCMPCPSANCKAECGNSSNCAGNCNMMNCK